MDDDQTFSTESSHWETEAETRNRKRRKVTYAALLLAVAAIVALALGVALFNKGDNSRSVDGATGPGGQGGGLVSGPPTTAPSTFSALLDFLQQNSLSDGSELTDPSTYQHKAYAWLEATSYQGLSNEALLQRFALACIYYATFRVRTTFTDAVYGFKSLPPPWNRTENWLVAQDECTWFGIVCNDNGHVADIELYSNSLSGSFPPEVVHLRDSLVALDLYNNAIWNQGDEGHSWLEHMTKLEYLYYGTTFFQYEGIPSYIGALTNLVEYDCSTTLYFGDLKGEIFTNLTYLNFLVLGGNSYNKTTIPSEIVDLPLLENFYIYNSDVQGNLDFMDKLAMTSELWIDKNPGIAGSIPTTIGQLSTLESFSAADCSLTGSLPTELGLLTNARTLWIYGNMLTGVVPSEMGAATKLELFELYDNLITGSMPAEVCNLVVPSTVGGNLSTLVPDCTIQCTCCTGCM